MRRISRLAVLAIAVLLGVVVAKEAPFRGNTETRVFHQPSCRYYGCPNCTAKFDTVQEAVDGGYRPCGTCRPAGAPSEKAAAAEASYVGNTRSHKFHRRTCGYAGCPNCTAKFASREEAIAAGYAPGGCCRP